MRRAASPVVELARCCLPRRALSLRCPSCPIAGPSRLKGVSEIAVRSFATSPSRKSEKYNFNTSLGFSNDVDPEVRSVFPSPHEDDLVGLED